MGRRGAFDFLYFTLCPFISNELNITVTSFFTVYLQLLFFLTVFFFGPTIYAPVTSFLTLSLYGILFGSLPNSKDFKTAVISLFFTALTGYILSIYASFVTLTSMKIFTDSKKSKDHIFEGTLFRANNFKGIFNFRYIGSYILFFIFFTAFASIVLIVKNYLISLL